MLERLAVAAVLIKDYCLCPSHVAKLLLCPSLNLRIPTICRAHVTTSNSLWSQGRKLQDSPGKLWTC